MLPNTTDATNTTLALALSYCEPGFTVHILIAMFNFYTSSSIDKLLGSGSNDKVPVHSSFLSDSCQVINTVYYFKNVYRYLTCGTSAVKLAFLTSLESFSLLAILNPSSFISSSLMRRNVSPVNPSSVRTTQFKMVNSYIIKSMVSFLPSRIVFSFSVTPFSSSQATSSSVDILQRKVPFICFVLVAMIAFI